MRASVALGFALVLLTATAWCQSNDQPESGWFRVSWQPRAHSVAPAIEGRVHNNSSYRVTSVRLRVEGLNADSEPVGQKFAWAFGDIRPGGETSFVVETMPKATTYRITVFSFDVVSVVQAP